ncbi:ribonuclease E/G [Acidisphaera sp. S103]|uniref:Rne/Rng family ribonuclease n=1 Tax=Acidisphaera sp. S103 TaxID=1747223 RepID=UPI00131D299E|nr:ribonuclease E/G [Acidisphaera sp. S103]
MTKRMLIDATHAEETRVVVLDGTRLEDFDVETSTKRQLKGNIYLAKVVRVEPSLQAAFVEYGGNRHGFLAFSEIHPDYYQIPVADRQRLIEMQAEDARREEEEEDLELALSQSAEGVEPAPRAVVPEPEPAAEDWALASMPRLIAPEPVAEPAVVVSAPEAEAEVAAEAWAKPDRPALLAESPAEPSVEPRVQSLAIDVERVVAEDEADADDTDGYDSNGDHIEVLPPPETVGGGDQETGDDQRERRMPPRFLRNYKIQEVIRRRQILLIQVVKEERGTKGAALTTYLSLAGRFGVLMPNSPRGGGISRKITSATDRRRLKEVMAELDIPRGMGMIVRTAGANRPKPEIKRDCEYLLRLWDDIREHTMKSVAPALIYEEASLIKRSIRDVYSRDIEEILVDGEDGWRAAHDFMRMLMPSHAKKVQLWRDGQPLFARNQVEAQLDGMLMPTVQLRSGGYLVINQAEALVAIDVNSGRSTRERNIEETALRTNLEAADEAARQLRLRDLAGLIVIDFIDMESKRHDAMVERRIKEALKNDRARIQVGHISHFGLLEMSRQRLRPSLAETSFILCPHCGGTGHVRSTENAAIHVLRGIEDEGSKRRSAEIVVHVSTPVALYLLNHKRERLQEIELRYTMRVIIAADDAQIAPQFRIEKMRTRSPDEIPPVVTAERPMPPASVADVDQDEEEEADAVVSEDEDDDDGEEDTAEQKAADAAGGGTAEDAERRRKRRRRRRRGGRRDEPQADTAEDPAGEAPSEPSDVQAEGGDVAEAAPPVAPAEPAEVSAEEPVEGGETAPPSDDDPRNRRRGRRGGRRRRSQADGELSPFATPGADQPELPPVYAGPTPADPFGGRVFDIFDVMDQAERAAEARPAPRAAVAAEIANNTAPEPDAPNAVAAEAAAEPQPVPEPEVPEAEIVNSSAPEPAGEALPAEPEPAAEAVPAEPEPVAEAVSVVAEAEKVTEASAVPIEAEAVPPVAANDVAPEPAPAEPAIKPILIGAGGEPPVERKRGWWRR